MDVDGSAKGFGVVDVFKTVIGGFDFIVDFACVGGCFRAFVTAFRGVGGSPSGGLSGNKGFFFVGAELADSSGEPEWSA